MCPRGWRTAEGVASPTDSDQRRTHEEWAGDKIRALLPLGRWQTPEDIANMIRFLFSARAAQVTGQTLNVDGGLVPHW